MHDARLTPGAGRRMGADAPTPAAALAAALGAVAVVAFTRCFWENESEVQGGLSKLPERRT